MAPTTTTAVTTATQILSISLSLIASGGIATLTIFDVPLLQSQPSSRSLPSTRWLFSRGSHIFPQAALISSAGFAYLAHLAATARSRTLVQLLQVGGNGARVNGYLAAAALTVGIAPFTSLMLPTNFELVRRNEERGGARSERSAREEGRKGRSAEESVRGEGQAPEFTDLSGPQGRTEGETSPEDDERIRALLGRFGRLNLVRALLMAGGGVVGLWAALL